ncbi:MAG: hypothetical protein Fur003_5180 [Candidatus Dojkabacteria bacterium]
MQITETVTIPKTVKLDAEAVEAQLKPLGYHLEPAKSQYEAFRMTGANGSLLFYTSNKIVAQLKSVDEVLITTLNQLAGNVASQSSATSTSGLNSSASFTPHIGSDEVGKGDFFGPLVVVACYVGNDEVEMLKGVGVGDSKKIADSKIVNIYEEISKKVDFEAVIIPSGVYNVEYAKYKNIATMLADKHAEAIAQLNQKLKQKGIECNEVVIDQFSSRQDRLLNAVKAKAGAIKVTQFHKGESDIAVATASVLARATFLLEWAKTEQEWGFVFPKGATDVINAGRLFVKNYGKERLSEVAKVSFVTTQKL